MAAGTGAAYQLEARSGKCGQRRVESRGTRLNTDLLIFTGQRSRTSHAEMQRPVLYKAT